MAFSARHTLSRGVSLPNPSIPRPGRRALSLSLGIALLLLLLDAVAHPRAITDLWAVKAIERLTGSEGAIIACTMGLVVVLAIAGRRRWWRRS